MAPLPLLPAAAEVVVSHSGMRLRRTWFVVRRPSIRRCAGVGRRCEPEDQSRKLISLVATAPPGS